MKTAARLSLAALVLFMLVACGGGSPAPTSDPASDPAEATAAEAEDLGRDNDATVFDDMIQTEDKARAVEDVTLGHKQDLDKALEASEGDTEDAGKQ